MAYWILETDKDGEITSAYCSNCKQSAPLKRDCDINDIKVIYDLSKHCPNCGKMMNEKDTYSMNVKFDIGDIVKVTLYRYPHNIYRVGVITEVFEKDNTVFVFFGGQGTYYNMCDCEYLGNNLHEVSKLVSKIKKLEGEYL